MFSGVFLLLIALCIPSKSFATFSLYDCDRDYIDTERNDCIDGINLEECQQNTILTYLYNYTGTATDGFYVYIGASCDVKENRDEGKCFEVPGFSNASPPTAERIEIKVEPAWVVDSMSADPTCVEGDSSSNIYLLILDSSAEQAILDSYVEQIRYDTQRPEAPVDVTAEYGGESVTVSWDVAGDNAKEWTYFRVLCYPTQGTTQPADASSDGSSEPDAAGDGDAVEDVPDEEDEADASEAEEVTGDAEEDATPDTGGGGDDAGSQDAAGEGSAVCPSGGFNEGDVPDEAYFCTGLLGSSTRSTTVDGLQNDVAYKFAVVAYDSFRNPSLLSEVACATPQEVCDFWCEYNKNNGEGGGFCFVATAAYGSPLHPFVGTLRSFRDEILSKLSAGRWLIAQYYARSPAAAGAIEDSPILKNAARVALLPAVAVAWLSVAFLHHPSLLLVIAGLILAGVLGGRRKKYLGSLLGMALVLFVAAVPGTLLAKEKKSKESMPVQVEKKWEGSPQHFAAELKFGPYYPDVDDEFGGGASPFRDVFGSTAALHGLFEFDYQFLRPPGISLGVGALIGGFQFSGKALNAETGEPSGEETTLSVLTTHLDAVLRVDALLRYTVVPLVPYVKGGLSYYIWWTSSHSGISEIDGEKGQGGTWGWNLQTGLMLCLDPLEPRAARTFDNEVGVNNSYLFAEFLLARLDDFGRGGALNLSDMTWLIGLALEF
jgi:hypothetical protein